MKIPSGIRTGISSVSKGLVTVVAFYILFSHQVQMIDRRPVILDSGQTVHLVQNDTVKYGSQTVTVLSGSKGKTADGSEIEFQDGHPVHLADNREGRIAPLETESTFEAIMNFLPNIKARTFWMFVCLAAFVKFIGILCSMGRWHLLLQGQGIRFPFRHLFGSFLIGRFLGTFLPSTIGLDGYKLYDASRFSRRTVECTAATIIEKTLGIVGLFITFLVALPFGRSILGKKAGSITLMTVPIASGVIAAFFLLLFYPAIIQWLIVHLPIPGKNRIHGFINRVNRAAAAYRDHKMLLLSASFMSFLVHFLTAAMYFYTALAIGATHARFWQVTFASSIQIFATVITPITIAGEGIREIAQYYLLRNQLGPAESIVSAALGFWAAEALTLLGAIFWWVRKKSYKPSFLYLDNKPADLESLLSSDDYGLEELRPLSSEPRKKGWMKQAFFTRIWSGAAGGIFAGVILGLTESAWTGVVKGAGQNLFLYGMLLYGIIGLLFGLGFGALTGIIALAFGRIKGSVRTFATAFSSWLAVNILILGRFLLNRDMFKEQGVPKPVLLILLIISGLVFVAGMSWGQTEKRRKDLWAKRPLIWSGFLLGAGLLYHFAAPGLSSSPAHPKGPTGIPEAVADKPNIVLIVCDALRADHVGCYGSRTTRTPVIDSLAENGIRFHSAYSQSSWTKPAVATILTALYPSGHKTYLKPDILPDDVITLPEVLQDAGYYTVGFPNNINITSGFNFDQGFNEFLYLSPDYFFSADEFSSRLTYYSILRKIREGFISKSKYPQHYYQEASVVTRHVQEFLDRHGRSSRFFLFLHFMEPHDPFFRHPFNGIGYARVNMPNPDPSLAPEMRLAYQEEINYLDEWIGKLFELLRKNGLWDNTIIVLTADHGEEFYDHGGWWHGLTLYQEVIHVPLIIRPDRKEAAFLPSTVRLDNARQIDIAPTILGLAKIPAPESMHLGRNLCAPGQDSDRDISVFAEEDHEGNVLKAYIEGPWKIIQANSGNPRGLPQKELFRLDIDPLELDDRAYHEDERLQAMMKGSAEAEITAGTGEVRRQEKQLSDDELSKMRELGYIQ
ncbi:sulfatase-like hydrolase/transferase [bacterium]|nr:sulfatase-like hydrolase/transferase [candidate division CSSED10-310 bacterium]